MATRKRIAKSKQGRDWKFYPSERDADKCRAALATYDAEVRAREKRVAKGLGHAGRQGLRNESQRTRPL